MRTDLPTPLQSLLQQALQLHQQGQLVQAKPLYQAVLTADPMQFDALHLLGVIEKQQGRTTYAIALIRRAIAIDPAHAGAHCNLGAALQDARCHAEALASFEHALVLRPDYAIAHNNRGNALRNLQRLDEAVQSYEQAIACKPDYAEAWRNRGTALQLRGEYDAALSSLERALQIAPEDALSWRAHGVVLQSLLRANDALRSYERALTINPNDAQAWCNRGIALSRLRDFEAALHSYTCALKIQPDYAHAHLCRANTLRSLQRNQEAIAAYQLALQQGADAAQVHYLLAALGVGNAPAAPPASYIKELFDAYADHFDAHLLQNLHYRTPELLIAALRKHLPAGEYDVLDLGCGTGLCAPHLQTFSATLSGIDLSENMLRQAATRGLYTHLLCADLHTYLPTQHAAYDLIVAADVLVYIGDLHPCFAAAKQALRPNGLFAFSVEASPGEQSVLRNSGRYAHSESALRELAAQGGWQIKEFVARTVREDNGAEIAGYLMVMASS